MVKNNLLIISSELLDQFNVDNSKKAHVKNKNKLRTICWLIFIKMIKVNNYTFNIFNLYMNNINNNIIITHLNSSKS